MSSKRLTDVERELLKGMLVDGAPNKEIAATFGVSTSMVTYYAVRMGLSRNDPPRPVVVDDEPEPRTISADASLSYLSRGLVPQGDWVEAALCAQTDNEAFFPEKGGSTREAKKVCAQCPVAAECLDYALANNERFGIWGGMSERERRKLQLGVDFDDSACGTYPKGYNRHANAGVPVCDDCRQAANAYARQYRETGTRTPIDINEQEAS